jgi:hypothetical protein
MLCGVGLLPVTDISGQHIGPIFKGQESPEDIDSLALEGRTDMLFQKVRNQLPS